MNHEKLKATIRFVTENLLRQDYAALYRLSGGIRLSADEIAEAINSYRPCTLTRIPEDELESLEIVEIRDSKPRQWAVEVDLWTVEEGRSDLTLELTLIDSDGDLYGVQIDNLHVL